MRLDVTADTNIYISALIFAGRPRQLLDAARGGTVRFNEAAAAVADFTIRVRPTRRIDAVRQDTDDNRVLECAIPARSRYIVTGDTNLLRLGEFEGIRVLRVADFMTLIDP